MSKPTACTCTLCGKTIPTEDATHLDLYVIGSEGITVCFGCRMILTKLAEGIMHTASEARMAGYKEGMKKARAYDAAFPTTANPKDVTDYASRHPSP